MYYDNNSEKFLENDSGVISVGRRNVSFGKYRWRVLDVRDCRALLLSEDILEERAYHSFREKVTWETSDIRGYLNGEFFKTFSSEEQRRIVSTINGHNNSPDATDRVFLLSVDDIVKYLGDSGKLGRHNGESFINDRYNILREVKYNEKSKWWWLRSSGSDSIHAAIVNCDGSVDLNGGCVNSGYGGLCPALWLNLSEDAKNDKPWQPVKSDYLTLMRGQRNVQFGKYAWRVLDVKDGKALLLSEEIIETRAYHNQYNSGTGVLWKDCDLRKYLNGEFLNNFNDDERGRIKEITNKNPDNQWYGTAGGGDASDRIFLLSIDEVVKYFGDSGALNKKKGNAENRIKYKYYNDKTWKEIDSPDISEMCCFGDKYSMERMAKYKGDNHWWWLRSPGGDRSANALVVIVFNDGSVRMSGGTVNLERGGVRPALWLNMKM